MYNWLQLAKILFKLYRKEIKIVEGDATIILTYELPDQKI